MVRAGAQTLFYISKRKEYDVSVPLPPCHHGLCVPQHITTLPVCPNVSPRSLCAPTSRSRRAPTYHHAPYVPPHHHAHCVPPHTTTLPVCPHIPPRPRVPPHITTLPVCPHISPLSLCAPTSRFRRAPTYHHAPYVPPHTTTSLCAPTYHHAPCVPPHITMQWL